MTTQNQNTLGSFSGSGVCAYTRHAKYANPTAATDVTLALSHPHKAITRGRNPASSLSQWHV